MSNQATCESTEGISINEESSGDIFATALRLSKVGAVKKPPSSKKETEKSIQKPSYKTPHICKKVFENDHAPTSGPRR